MPWLESGRLKRIQEDLGTLRGVARWYSTWSACARPLGSIYAIALGRGGSKTWLRLGIPLLDREKVRNSLGLHQGTQNSSLSMSLDANHYGNTLLSVSVRVFP